MTSEFWMKQITTAAAVAASAAAANSAPERCVTATPTSVPQEQKSMPGAGGAASQQQQPPQLPKGFLPGAAQMGLGMAMGMQMQMGVGMLGGPGSGLHHPPLGLCKPKKMRKPRTSTPPLTAQLICTLRW